MLDVILSWPNLVSAWEQVAENRGAPGPDRISIQRFARHWEENLRRLQELVRSGRYRPGGLRRVAIPKRDGGQRLLSIPNIGDRVLQRAVLNQLEWRLDRRFLSCSYGYRPRRGLRQAVAAILQLRDRGQTWVVDADIDDCFDSLDHLLLGTLVRQAVDDPGVAAILDLWIGAGRRWRSPDRGIAQGMPVSPLLCNLYLHEMDWALVRRRWNLVRYADDFILCCGSRAEAEQALDATALVLERLKLRLEPRKTGITSFNQGFEFLGVHFQGRAYSFTWGDKQIEVTGSAPDWLWSYAPRGYA
jgi:CRISPR-associated protein Cas1